MLQAQTLLEQQFDLLVQTVLVPKLLVALSPLLYWEFHFRDERPASAEES
jgi:hypothetical protein